MKKLLIVLAVAAVVLPLAAGWAWGQASVTYTFTADTPASAAEVNKNFQDLVGAIDTNQTAITAINSAATPLDATYGPTQYSTAKSLEGRNVIVLMWKNPADTKRHYWIRIGYKDGIVQSAARPYVREFVDATMEAGALTYLTYMKEGSDSIDQNQNNTWYMEEIDYSSGLPLSALPLPSVPVANTRTREFYCLNPAVSGTLRHCRLRYKDSVTTTEANPFLNIDYSRFTTIAGAFTTNTFSFLDGLRGSFLGNAHGRDFFVNAKDVGTVVDTRYVERDTAYRTFRLIYFRIEGYDGGNGSGVAVGSLSGTPFESTGLLGGIFFTP